MWISHEKGGLILTPLDPSSYTSPVSLLNMTSDSRLRVALLITDTPAPPVVDRCGDYKVMFTSLLEKAASAHVPAVDVQVVPFDVRHAQVYPEDLSTFDAALITGSGWWHSPKCSPHLPSYSPPHHSR